MMVEEGKKCQKMGKRHIFDFILGKI